MGDLLSETNELIGYFLILYYLYMCMTKQDIIYHYMDNVLLKGLNLDRVANRLCVADGRYVILYLNGSYQLYVNDATFDELCHMFSLTNRQAGELFKRWCIRNLDVPEYITVTRGFF